MKKRWKVLGVICVVLLITGIVCVGAAAAMGVSFRDVRSRFPNGISLFSSNSRVQTDEDSFTDHQIGNGRLGQFDHIKDLDVEIEAGSIKILTHDESYIAVEKEGGSSKWKVNCYQDGDELQISTDDYNWWSNYRVGTVYVYLPEDIVFEDAEIDMGAGEMDIQYLSADTLSCNFGAGDSHINNFETKDLEIECGAGKVVASGILDGDAALNTGVGDLDLTLSGQESDYNYDITVGIGEARIADNKFSGIGNGQYRDNGAQNDIDITCSIGTAALSFR